MLIIFEADRRGRPAATARALAAGAGAAGTDIRLTSPEDTGAGDVRWADALALGISGRGAVLPREAKRRLDTLGFAGWRAFRGKPGCVFATTDRASADSDAACRMLARLLERRRMATWTTADPVLTQREDVPPGTAFACLLGSRLAQHIRTSDLAARPAGANAAPARRAGHGASRHAGR